MSWKMKNSLISSLALEWCHINDLIPRHSYLVQTCILYKLDLMILRSKFNSVLWWCKIIKHLILGMDLDNIMETTAIFIILTIIIFKALSMEFLKYAKHVVPLQINRIYTPSKTSKTCHKSLLGSLISSQTIINMVIMFHQIKVYLHSKIFNILNKVITVMSDQLYNLVRVRLLLCLSNSINLQ